MASAIIVRNRAKCIICYGPHSSMENGPGVHRQFADTSDLLKRAFDINFPRCFNEYGVINICRPCFNGHFQEAEVLYEKLMEIENQFKSKAQNLATTVIDSVYKSEFLNQNPNGNAFDSTRFLVHQRWLRLYLKNKNKNTTESGYKESSDGLEEMDTAENEEDEVEVEPAKSTAIQWDSNRLVNGKLEKIATVNDMTIVLKEKEDRNEVGNDTDSTYENLNSIIANQNEGTFVNNHKQKLERQHPTNTTAKTFPISSRKKFHLLKRYPVIQKVERPSASHPKMKSAAYFNLKRPQDHQEKLQLEENLSKEFSAQVILKPVSDISDPEKFNKKKLIYMKRDPKTGKVTCMKPPTGISNLDLIKKSKVFSLVRNGNMAGEAAFEVPVPVGRTKNISPNYKSVQDQIQAPSSSLAAQSQQQPPKSIPLPSRFENGYDKEKGETSTSFESSNDSLHNGSELVSNKNPIANQNQLNQVRKHKQDQGQKQQPEISPPEVKRSKRTIKRPMHYDEQNYIYDSAGNGKEMDRLILEEGRKNRVPVKSNRMYRARSNPIQEEFEAEDEEPGEIVYVPNKWNPENPVDSEEEDIDLVKDQQFVIENSDGEEIDLVDFKGRKRNSNGAAAGQGQKARDRMVSNRTNLIIEEVDEDNMIERKKATEAKIESNKFKCVFCPKFFPSLEKKIEHEVLHADF